MHCSLGNRVHRFIKPYANPKTIFMETILIADGHALIRKGIRMIIEGFQKKYKIIETSTCSDVKKLMGRRQVQYAIVDLLLPDGNLLFPADNMLIYSQQVKILVYTASTDKLYARWLFQKGIRGYLCKQSSIADLEKAIGTVLNNEIHLTASQKEILFKPAAASIPKSPFELLTAREITVAEGLLTGIGTSELARMMELDKSTVSTYRKRLFEKMEVKNVLELKDKFIWYQMQR